MEAVRELLGRGANPNAADEDEGPAWATAIESDSVPIVDALLRAGCAVDPHEALNLVRGVAMLRRLLDHGVDINGGDEGQDPPIYAIATDHIFEAFLRAGADPNRTTSEHETPLTFHASWGNLAVVERLLEYGGDPNYVDTEVERSVLEYAAEWGNLNIVIALLDAGADLHRSFEGKTALTHALLGGHVAVAELLVERGAVVGEADRGALELLALRIGKLGGEG
ncbi:Ankyrin [Enhygromyxa salina]|uniref:Ankyrin n=1 Tax=Enhygromyxa salina TaxID=215803 RepID=A0A0C1ZYC8_9BACT|nr:Ankyrin [Enhygromyxa salina]